MKKILIVISIIAALSAAAFGQKTDDAKDALAVVNQLFDMMAAHKPAEIVALHTDGAQLAAVVKNKEGKTATRMLSTEAFSKMFAEKRSEIKEVMYDPKTEVHGDLALVWGRYVFFVNGKVSHCGVNAFHMVRTDAGWRIAGGSSSIDPQACTEREKAMKVAAEEKK